MISTEENARHLRGAFDDIMSLLVLAESSRNPAYLDPRDKRGADLVFEPLGIVVGQALAAASRLAPSDLSMSFQDHLWRILAGKLHFPFDPAAPGLVRAAGLLAGLERNGRRPGLLCLVSHPPLTDGTSLSIEMMRHVMMGLYALRKKCPRTVVAVDPFAIDMIPIFQQGAYSGFMAHAHMGFDRMIHLRPALNRWLQSGIGYDRIAWRLAKALRRGEGVGMVLSGGVTENSRPLYAAREFLIRLRRIAVDGATGKPEFILGVKRKLMKDPDFSEFYGRGPVGNGIKKSLWRTAEAWIIARLVGRWPAPANKMTPAESGTLTEDVFQSIQTYARALGYRDGEFDRLYRDFSEEFSRETPYRERFFRFIVHEIVARGTPLLLLPLNHRTKVPGPQPHGSIAASWGTPVALISFREGRIVLRSGDNPADDRSVTIEQFAKEFVEANYF